ncbi:MAG: phosphoglycolate phosphatase [Sterolibacterium sp.]|nr:phosphoglycolate phosphatase [Sterolibacterium sp.]
MRAAATEAVLFDLDGTLADTALDLGAALNQVLQAVGRANQPMSAIRPVASAGTKALLKLGFGHEIDPQNHAHNQLIQRFLDHYAATVCVHTVLFDGIAGLLDTLEQRGIPWGVVTNKPQRFTLPLLDSLGLSTRSACIVSGDTTARPKPAPDALLHACQQLDVPPQGCLYVGDDERDIIAGRAAGMRTVVASWGYLGGDSAPASWNATAMIDRPAQLLELL